MQSESTETRLEPDVVVKPSRFDRLTTKRGTRRIAWSLVAIVLLIGYTAGFFTRPMLMPATQPLEPMEIDPDRPLTESYQRLEQQVAELSNRAGQRRSPGLDKSVDELAQEIKDLRTLNPYVRFKEIQAATIPSGVPAGYGDILQVSFDEVQASIDVLSRMDPTFGADKVELQGPALERYIRIGQQTACRYCCDAQTLVFDNGEAACGCEHSQAMRGLAAYLLTEYGDEYSNEEIGAELNKWRATYFPKQTLGETLLRMKQAGEPGIAEIEAEFPEFMPDMVGEC